MRTLKRNFSICLSHFPPELSSSLSVSSFRIRFSSGIPASRLSSFDRTPLKQNQIHSGSCKLRSGSMDGIVTFEEGKDAQYQCEVGESPCIWSSPSGGCNVPIGKQIFCNRSLNMKNIVAVGFDMDYTLAQYKPETFESLAYEGTIKKLVFDLGYPSQLLEWSFDWKYMVRGLVLDKKRGNILKMDRHKYVKVAYHGFTEMSKEEKVETYGNTLTRDSFDEPDYALIDTLFSLAEAYLFAQLVDFKDKNPGRVPAGADYPRLYKDVRAAVDLCHRDGTLKQMVAKDPQRVGQVKVVVEDWRVGDVQVLVDQVMVVEGGSGWVVLLGVKRTQYFEGVNEEIMYISHDTSIIPMLQMLRDSGRSTFLVTNSLWDYTNVVMNFLCRKKTANGSTASNFDWLKYFDVVITGSAKPGFFHEGNRANLFEVVPDSGMLLNTDNGTPMAQVGITVAPPQLKGLDKACRVFQGGCVGHLHKLLNIESSSQFYRRALMSATSSILSMPRDWWRTMLVVPELEREVELLWQLRGTRKQLQGLRCDRDHIEDKLHRAKWFLKFEDLTADKKQTLSSDVDRLETQRELARLDHQQILCKCHQKFHMVWGQLMKTGYQNSRFAHQVERFACLYTSQVTNLSLYSPDKYYRPSEDFMPHEFDILALSGKCSLEAK
ncbi:Cytosolic purine 5'-nucleotidase [Bienertia sinuspersici]